MSSQPSPTPASALREIARTLRRLHPDWRDPERYFENRSEIENRLCRLARELEEQNAY